MNEQLAFLRASIEDRLKGSSGRSRHYKRYAFSIFISTAVLAAVSSILLGLKLQDPAQAEVVRITVLVISSVISIATVYSAFFNHRELWIANNDAVNRFYKLRFKMDFREKSKEPLTPVEVEEYAKEYQTIVDDQNQAWERSRRANAVSKG